MYTNDSTPTIDNIRRVALHINTNLDNLDSNAMIFEVACVEMHGVIPTGNNFHRYIQPNVALNKQQMDYFGVTNDYLADKPRFSEVIDDLSSYLNDSEILVQTRDVIHCIYRQPGGSGGAVTFWDYYSTEILTIAQRKYSRSINDLESLCHCADIYPSYYVSQHQGGMVEASIIADAFRIMLEKL